jgi:hypothetical protein
MAASLNALIAYDGSACAEAALGDLKRAGLPDEVGAIIVTVAELWLPVRTENYILAMKSPFSDDAAPIPSSN